jgi:glycerophosphoryl diester phosphodiesterase
MKNSLFLLMLILITCACASSVQDRSTNGVNCQPKDFVALKSLFRYNPQQNKPLIMAHRGGPAEGFPENCLATFRHTLQHVPCLLMEFDVRMSKDSVLLLAHDDELERMSNGTGFVSKSLWKDLKALYLKNEEEQVTSYHPPLFKEMLDFLRKKPCILIIDNKPGTAIDLVLQQITQAKVENQAVLICYSLKDAEYVYQKKPNLMLALGFNQEPQIMAIEKSVIPKDQLVALTPRDIQPAGYYERIHALGISCSLGTNGNIDTLPLADSKALYWERFRAGADIICTDRPVEVARVFGTNKQ